LVETFLKLRKLPCKNDPKGAVSACRRSRFILSASQPYHLPNKLLVVWRLDRLGRSLRHLIDTVTSLNERGVEFKSLQENIDTTTSGGKLVFHIFGALAEFEVPELGL
jgi:DNA invertase Pin-like site-specific DNA recombinase